MPNSAWDPKALCVVGLMALPREDTFNTCHFLKTEKCQDC